MIDPKDDIIQKLRSKIMNLERIPLSDMQCSFISSGFEQLDDVLPSGGLPLGSLIELLSEEASGALGLALNLARRAIEAKAAWAVVDVDGSFYPPAAAQRGLDTDKLLVIRTRPSSAAWAFGQLLRCPDVGASFLYSAGCQPAREKPQQAGCLRYLDNMTYRRLQLAAERGGGLGFVLRDTTAARRPCWAALRLLVGSGTGNSPMRSLKVTVLHVRGSNASGSVVLDIDL